jgi:phenylacetic acid degradation operon negative regulatory protein
MGIKERRTKILLGLLLFSDVKFAPVLFNEQVQIPLDLTLNQKTKGTLAGLIKEGAIEKSEDNTYRLTDKGFNWLCLDFPVFRYLKHNWDGKWRVLSYEIPEKKRDLRDKLRREVAGWGLGPWHRSFWLTPHPIIENLRALVSQKEEEQYIQAFEADHVFGDRKVLIEKVWNTTALDKKYRDLFKHWHDILSGEGEKTTKLTKVIALYVSILREDPGLPTELVGQSWIGYEAFNIFKEIRSILLS